MRPVDKEYDAEESEWLKAIRQYQEKNRRPFPLWSEILAIAQALGYRKVAKPCALPKYQKREKP